jgi:hypothetical protein
MAGMYVPGDSPLGHMGVQVPRDTIRPKQQVASDRRCGQIFRTFGRTGQAAVPPGRFTEDQSARRCVGTSPPAQRPGHKPGVSGSFGLRQLAEDARDIGDSEFPANEAVTKLE